uniref:Uncharacterized protein n=1 Tax=Arundo donax TaxID=35708 RepID=A0A0A9CRD6_ARUDO
MASATLVARPLRRPPHGGRAARDDGLVTRKGGRTHARFIVGGCEGGRSFAGWWEHLQIWSMTPATESSGTRSTDESGS